MRTHHRGIRYYCPLSSIMEYHHDMREQAENPPEAPVMLKAGNALTS
jgi:hypothetical protein